ncbi:hypothetical protein [uncultured Nonlabens sp.]|uniref:hypothetical protein n=1 Tax=uncultured Nonlabens sp. TaxID=859306 RepID=UPI002629451C|nr:hypothetical protein [uncultured Nonlabens sp.]
MRNLILFIILFVIIVSCNQSKDTYEIAISDVLHKTFFRSKNCNSDFYYNIIIRNDTLFVDGIFEHLSGTYTGILNDIESKGIIELINGINPKNRTEKEINPTTGMTAMIVKKKEIMIDSIVDFRIKWNQSDLNLFNYVGKLICEKELIKTDDSISFPTWEMIKPPE